MEIILKTGEKITLEVSSLIFEYLEEYDGGFKQLEKDIKGEIDENGYSRMMYATNHLLYAIIASNYEEELTPKLAIKLVKLEDIPEIIKFINKNIPKIKKDLEKPEKTKTIIRKIH